MNQKTNWIIKAFLYIICSLLLIAEISNSFQTTPDFSKNYLLIVINFFAGLEVIKISKKYFKNINS